MMWGTGYMGWSWGFGLLAIAGVALIIYVVVRLLANRNMDGVPPKAPSPPEPTGARRILDERFARGELTAEQYRDQVRVLGEDQ